MAKCMSCGKTTLLTTCFGDVTLCKNCGALLNVSTWSGRDFDSMEELMQCKENTLQKANASKMSSKIIEKVAHYFDEYINLGFITSINGKAGQTLKVFSNSCIISTKSETSRIGLENMFYQFDDDDYEDDDIFTSEDKKNLVRGLMSGKIVQAGIGAALSATMNQYEKEKMEEKKSYERHRKVEKLITVGDRRVDLRNVVEIETFSKANTANGYLRFVKKGAKNPLYDCEYFFFNNSIPFESKKIKKKIEVIKNILEERIIACEYEVKNPTPKKVVEKKSKPDVFEEVKKFKNLLDEGIITEEEFNIKKKQLLGL